MYVEHRGMSTNYYKGIMCLGSAALIYKYAYIQLNKLGNYFTVESKWLRLLSMNDQSVILVKVQLLNDIYAWLLTQQSCHKTVLNGVQITDKVKTTMMSTSIIMLHWTETVNHVKL